MTIQPDDARPPTQQRLAGQDPRQPQQVAGVILGWDQVQVGTAKQLIGVAEAVDPGGREVDVAESQVRSPIDGNRDRGVLDQRPPTQFGLTERAARGGQFGHVGGHPRYGVDLTVGIEQRELRGQVAVLGAVRVGCCLLKGVPVARQHDLLVVPAVVAGRLLVEQVEVGSAQDRPIAAVKQRLGSPVRQQVAPIAVLGVHRHIAVLEHPVQHPAGPLQRRLRDFMLSHLTGERIGLPPVFQFGDHLSGQRSQQLELLRIEQARDSVEDAQCPQHMTVRGDEWGAGVEADVRIVGDRWVAGKPRVQRRVRHDQHLCTVQSVGAERDLPAGRADVQADPGLEPLPVLVHQAHQRHRGCAHLRRQRGQVVEGLLRRRVQHAVAGQRRQPGQLALSRTARGDWLTRVLAVEARRGGVGEGCGLFHRKPIGSNGAGLKRPFG